MVPVKIHIRLLSAVHLSSFPNEQKVIYYIFFVWILILIFRFQLCDVPTLNGNEHEQWTSSHVTYICVLLNFPEGVVYGMEIVSVVCCLTFCRITIALVSILETSFILPFQKWAGNSKLSKTNINEVPLLYRNTLDWLRLGFIRVYQGLSGFIFFQSKFV
jgi:hypothetical protein